MEMAKEDVAGLAEIVVSKIVESTPRTTGFLRAFECGDFKCLGSFTCESKFTVHFR